MSLHLTTKECPCHVYSDLMPLKQIIGQTITYCGTTSAFKVESWWHTTLWAAPCHYEHGVARGAHCIRILNKKSLVFVNPEGDIKLFLHRRVLWPLDIEQHNFVLTDLSTENKLYWKLHDLGWWIVLQVAQVSCFFFVKLLKIIIGSLIYGQHC